jgi:tetratricopeptide (TPR) repeat protein
MSKLISTIIFITIILPLDGRTAVMPSFLSADTTGCGALIYGNCQKALTALWGQKQIDDSAYWNFKKGVGHLGIKDYNNATACFLYCISKDQSLASVCYEYLGDMAAIRNLPRNAINYYMNAQKDSLIQPEHYNEINNKIIAIAAGNKKLIDSVPFLKAWQKDSTEQKKEPDRIPVTDYNQVDSLVFCKNINTADSLLACFFDSENSWNTCQLISRLRNMTIPDTLLTTKRLFQLSAISMQCRMYDIASLWMTKAKTKPDFSTVINGQTSLRQEGMLSYYLGDFERAIKLLTDYKKNYGPIPQIIITLARAYRNTGKDNQSLETYSLFVKLFPDDPLTSNVLWNLAIEYDQRGYYSKAIAYYHKFTRIKNNKAKAADAIFRTGLCHFKSGAYSKACATMNNCYTKYPNASTATACLYWKAQSLIGSKYINQARSQFADIIKMAPTDYYAYRSKEALALMGDTSPVFSFDTVMNYDRSFVWLDSVTSESKGSLTSQDSLLLFKCRKLVLSGCFKTAGYYMSQMEKTNSGNLPLLYNIAVLYDIMNDPTSSYRVSRRLFWKLPLQDRTEAPLPFYRLAYPLAYYDIVKRSSEADTVDPCLILGIMRQESIFTPDIISKAGAVGLMQLMPATAKTVATELSETFAIDSLKSPSVNIRYGSHYIKTLLDKFHGNMVQAIACYNGGPGATMRWFEKNKSKSFDIFIEDIGYEETRGYVKKVLANYWTYTLISRILKTQ